ncbi:NAD(P)/FAD-dependent oxidoreductase [Paenirhodobacter sp.]|uniref:NAD(P)/FAD-dependent oxidoreductase n=1 Tax=Paenirhodobacter sp. TaxID=1965326 RepID=UPI003B3D22B3
MPDYRARRLPNLAGPAAWESILGPRTPLPPLDGTLRADFAIVGGGFAGLSAARRLLQLEPRAKIVLLDAGQIAQGSAGRNSGFMIDLPHELTSEDYAGADAGSDRALIALNRHAIGFAAEAVAEYAIPAGYFRRDGKVNGAASAHADAQNTTYAHHLASIGEAHEILDASAMRELTGSDWYRSGLYTPGTVMIQPAGYIRGLLGGLAPHVTVHENTPVTGLVRLAQGWQVQTLKGRVEAGTVILANNGHLESFGFAERRLMHIFLFACMTAELPPGTRAGHECWGVTPSDPMGTTMRRISAAQGGNRIITRTMAKLLPGMVTTPGQMRHAMAMMREKFDQRFPALKGFAMEYSWAGHLCLTQNNSSIAGRLDQDLFGAGVCNGLGTTRSTLTGIAAAEAALGHDSDATRFFAAQHLPNRLPPAPLAQIGANMFIRWKEWRARRE